MPTSIDVTEVRFGQSCDAELLHEPIQGRAMKVIQFGPGALSLPNLIHRRHIGAAPGVDQSGPVGLETELKAVCRQLIDQACAPIDDSTERIKEESARMIIVGPFPIGKS